MTLQKSIAEWLQGRPPWLQSVAVRICDGEAIGDQEIDELVDALVSDQTWDIAEITESLIPGASASPGAVLLNGVSGVEGINALAAEQSLTFPAKGLTVVYGDNGSGKSGYARLLRTAVRARVHGEVLGNVFDSGSLPTQHAIFDYSVGQSGQVHEWKWGEPFSDELAEVQFYDDDCGRAYISTASEITYRPSALTLLDKLIHVSDLVREAIDLRLRKNADSRPALPALSQETEGGRFLSLLSGETSSSQIVAATTLGEDHAKQLSGALQLEANLKSSDPTKERLRLTKLAGDYGVIIEHCRSVYDQLCKESVDDIVSVYERASDLRAAAKVASLAEFSEMPLEGVGSATWRKLWVTAKEYSEAMAYPRHEFPHAGESSRCVLCQQPLDAEGASRLISFQAFMTDTTERDATAAEKELTEALTTLESLTIQSIPQHVAAAMSQIQVEDDDKSAEVQEWLESASAFAKNVSAWMKGTHDARPTELFQPPIDALKASKESLSERAKSIDASSFLNQLHAASSRAMDLQSKSSISNAKVAILAEVERLAFRASLEAARRLTDTTGITRKASELTKEYVTGIVRDHFVKETERLRLRRITLSPKSARKGSLHHLPALSEAATFASVTDVLSEGEKTALGLAGFFTEVEFNPSLSAVILDDPITSLDHSRRSLVAKRIVDLAAVRQVIVFTHDVVFVGDLVRHSSELKVPVCERWISRRGDVTGYCADVHPWKAKDVNRRLAELEAELGRITKTASTTPQEEYEEKCASWAGKLSETWERAVNLEIVYEVVDRGTSQVKPAKFRIFAAITDQDNEDFQFGYGRTSEWARRHDKDPEVNFVPPTPDEMEKELNRAKGWFQRIKGYRK